MDNLKFSAHLLLRMPAMPVTAYEKPLQAFLDEPYFLSAVYLASPGFFSRLKKAGFSEQGLSPKERASLKKYINRICFRPTPFGLFSSVSLIRWEQKPKQPLLNDGELRIHISADEEFTAALHTVVSGRLRYGDSLLRPNDTLYRVLNEYRFIRTDLGENGKSRQYLLESIAYSRFLKDLMTFCRNGKRIIDIISRICRLTGCTTADAQEYVSFLTDSQLLVSDLRQNITGQPYLERLVPALSNDPAGHSFSANLSRITLKMALPQTLPGYFEGLTKELKQILPDDREHEEGSLLNVLLCNPLPHGMIDQKYQSALTDGITALGILCPQQMAPAMAQFIKDFTTYFEGQRVPLLKALDPEAGIGYGPPEKVPGNQLLETLHILQKDQAAPSITWSAAHSYLLQCWHSAKEKARPVIRLQEKELIKLAQETAKSPPTGMSVLFRVTANKVYIESAGGTNTAALIGRFTVTDPALQQAAVDLALEQERLNPHIIFAEILHLSDPHTDNVNRRAPVWSWELPLTANSLLQNSKQLELSDLYLEVENGRVIITSDKHGKVVLPMLSSAYNHALNKLPLFRFLADIPGQYGQSVFTIDLRHYYPGLSFYPRIEYKDTILHAATWVLNEQQLLPLQSATAEHFIAGFHSLAESLHLCSTFSLTEGDQQLVFDMEKSDDLLFLASCIQQKKEIVLKEYFTAADGNEQVTDHKGSAYAAQFNAFLYPSKPMPLYAGSGTNSSRVKSGPRHFLPGSGWLYLKLYTPKTGTDRLLIRLLPLLRRKYATGRIRKWFFIRYDDHAPHIRIRLDVDPAAIAQLLSAFKSLLENSLNEHVIREYQVDVYSRELERYGAVPMPLAEEHFWASSELVIQYVKKAANGESLPPFHFALVTVLDLIAAFISAPDEQIRFSFQSYARFASEFNNDGLKVDLDRQYRKLFTGMPVNMNAPVIYRAAGLMANAKRFQKSAALLSRSVAENGNDFHTLLESIIHMHLNRLFRDDARKQEMVVYYFLFKFLQGEKGKQKLRSGDPKP
ncbi:hypothetical protein FFF34_002775 [Inquilinus sp. KBS0705]|nr:hypothetical protein FFF34_002775 [Inquilinus sp. KBS0705]